MATKSTSTPATTSTTKRKTSTKTAARTAPTPRPSGSKTTSAKTKSKSKLPMLIAVVIVIIATVVAALFLMPDSKNGLTSAGEGAGAVNEIEQAKQTIMVMPSDQLLRKNGSMTATESMGKTIYTRDYSSFLLSGNLNKQVVTTIQRSFSDSDYPPVDLEQSLKSIENQNMLDAADGIAKDAKTILLTTARPDVIVEFDYNIATQLKSRTESTTQLSYSIVLLDAFSNKSIGSISNPGITIDDSVDDRVSAILNVVIRDNMDQLTDQIEAYFNDIVTNGREITFTVSTASGSAVNLQDMYNSDGDSYGTWVRNWVKANAKMGAATMQRNTSNEMHFVNVRIENLQDDGQQFNAYDFAEKFRRDFYRTFQIQTSNVSQGLATAQLIIK